MSAWCAVRQLNFALAMPIYICSAPPEEVLDVVAGAVAIAIGELANGHTVSCPRTLRLSGWR
jgi:hypothetical protein